MFYFLRHFQHIILLKDLSSIIDNKVLLDEFNVTEFTKNKGNLITLNKHLLERTDELKIIKNTLQDEAYNFLINAYKLEGMFEKLIVTNSWGNLAKKGQNHHEHAHPFSVVSGVYFVDNSISNYNFTMHVQPPLIPYFQEQRSCSAMLPGVLIENNIPLNTIKNNLQGHALFFMSNIVHSVLPVKEDEVRRTLSFNTFYKGLTGEKTDELARIVF